VGEDVSSLRHQPIRFVKRTNLERLVYHDVAGLGSHVRHRGRYLAHDSRKDVIFRVGLGRIGSRLVGVDSIE
jgi:hypothetical protein